MLIMSLIKLKIFDISKSYLLHFKANPDIKL